MAIDPEDMKHLEDALVHDAEEEDEPIPEGWHVYLTQKFLSKSVVLAYGILLLSIIISQVVVHGERVLILFMPVSALVALPIAIAGFYLNFVTPDERIEIRRKRTTPGRVIAVLLVFVVFGLVTVLTMIGLQRAFTLQ